MAVIENTQTPELTRPASSPETPGPMQNESLVLIGSLRRSGSPTWDFVSDWAQFSVHPEITPVYGSHDEMRWGPRRYDATQTDTIRRAVAERQPLRARPLPLD